MTQRTNRSAANRPTVMMGGRVGGLLVAAVALACACGGKSVIESGVGGSQTTSTSSSGTSTSSNGSSGSSSSSNGSSGSSSSGGTDCVSLEATYTQALKDAVSCDACIDFNPCAYLSGPPLTDPCGCPVAVNSSNPELVSAATSAYQAWIDAGCGPYPCGEPCTISNNPTCQPLGNGCAGMCK